MSIQVSLSETDYRCLLENAGKNSSMHFALSGAAPTLKIGAGTTRKVVCGVIDTIHLLRLAHEVCPDAVPDIRKLLTIFSSQS